MNDEDMKNLGMTGEMAEEFARDLWASIADCLGTGTASRIEVKGKKDDGPTRKITIDIYASEESKQSLEENFGATPAFEDDPTKH